MSNAKKSEKFKHESQDARRRDEHNFIHPDNKSDKKNISQVIKKTDK